MAVTRASLLVLYPEFTAAPSTFVDAHIASAIVRIDADVFGSQTDIAIVLLACHMMASSQYAERLALKDGTTTYERLLNEISMRAGAAWRM